jgi:hypothetical protein
MRNSVSARLGVTFLTTALFTLAAVARPQQQSQNPPPQLQQPGGDSVADASRKAKTDKPKTTPKKVYTDEDIPSLKAGGLSVVGDKNAGTAADSGKPDAKPAGDATKGGKDEAYWRGRAQRIRDQLSTLDQQISQLKDEIKKGGGAGFDMQTGRDKNVAYIEDRNSRLKSLEKKRDDVQKQMEALEDEARQAGVPAGWLR